MIIACLGMYVNKYKSQKIKREKLKYIADLESSKQILWIDIKNQ